MKKPFFAFIIALLCTGLRAQEGKLELGIILGNPTGMNAKYWVSEALAINAALGYNFRSQGHLFLSADLLAHPWSRDVEGDVLRVFGGLGADLGFMSELGVSARIPVGAAHQFSAIPLVFFAEVVPTIRITGPGGAFWLSAYLGLRWHF